MAKVTLSDGTVFVGTAKEYGEFYYTQEKMRQHLEAEEAQGKPVELQVGDRVKVLADGECGGVYPGEIGVIEKPIDSDGQFKVRGDSDYDWFYSSQLEKVSAQEKPVEFTLKEETTTLSVGDYAKVVPHDNTNFFGGKPGDIVKIIDVRAGVYNTQELNGGSYAGNPNALKAALVKATDAEVAEAKAAQAAAKEVERWAKIGRKVDEFRKGDIVEVIRTCGAGDGINKGDLIEVVEDSTTNSARVKAEDMSTGAWAVVAKLVTPVESRFDRN